MCPLGAPLDPMTTEMVPQVPKIQPEDLQNNNLRYKKTPISIATSQQPPASKGAGGRGEALKYLIYIHFSIYKNMIKSFA